MPPSTAPPLVPRRYRELAVWSDHGGLFPWPSRLVDVDGGVRQAVVDEGPRDAPLTFVCLHGNPTWGFLYRDFIRGLSARHRVVVPDHVGFGRSDKPRDLSYYSLPRHARNLTRTLDALDVRNAVLVVQDWGGPIGMAWATAHPDRVKGAVVMNSWAFVREGGLDLPWLFKALVRDDSSRTRVIERNFFTEVLLRRMGTRRPLDPRVLDAYRSAHPEPEDRWGIWAFPRMIPEPHDTGHPSWRVLANLESNLASLRDTPALLVWAKKDPAFREAQLERWRRVFPHAEGPHVLEAKHYMQEDVGDAIVGNVQDWAARVTR